MCLLHSSGLLVYSPTPAAFPAVPTEKALKTSKLGTDNLLRNSQLTDSSRDQLVNTAKH